MSTVSFGWGLGVLVFLVKILKALQAGLGGRPSVVSSYNRSKQRPEENEARLLGVACSISGVGGKLHFQRPQENFTCTGLLKGDGQIGKWRQREEKHTAQDICSDRGSSEVRTRGPQTPPEPAADLFGD